MDVVALIEAVIIVLVIVVLAAYAWYHMYGWTKFAYTSGNTVSWVSSTGKTESLRFKNAKFTLYMPDGTTRVWDVSEVLNSMAIAYEGTVGAANTGTLMLRVLNSSGNPEPSPLNPFSFIKTGVNDTSVVSDPTASPWPNVTVSLVGSWRTI